MPAFLYQQNTLRDALVAATSLDIFNRHGEAIQPMKMQAAGKSFTVAIPTASVVASTVSLEST